MKKESGLHNFAILSGREHIYPVPPQIPTRAAESSSNFEISGPAGLNVNMGIMLIVAVPSPLGHSSSAAIFWPLFAVRTVYTDRTRTEVVQKDRTYLKV